MKALILAAGLGNRLYPLTSVVPKPMVQIANRPCMEYAIRLLAAYGITDIIVNVHYLSELIISNFGDGSSFGVNITYSFEKDLMGTAGGLKRVQKFFDKEGVLIISGDALTDMNLDGFLRFHQENGGIATLALKQVADPTQYGVVAREGRLIKAFQEKPKREDAISLLANTGIYLFDNKIFEYIPADMFYDFGKNVFPDLLANGERIYGYPMREYWCDIGEPAAYREVHYDMLTGMVNVRLPGKKLDCGIYLGERVFIHPDTTLVGPILLGDHCTVAEGAKIIGPAIIGNHTFVGRDVIIRRGILWDHVTVKDFALLTDCVVTTGCVIPENIILKNEMLEKSILDDICKAAAINMAQNEG